MWQFKANDPWTTHKKDAKSFIIEHLKISRSQYIAIFVINHGQYIDNMFTLENFAYTSYRQLINVINSNLPMELNGDIILPKYSQLLMDRYSDTTFLIRQIIKQHEKFNHAGNNVSNHPDVASGNIS